MMDFLTKVDLIGLAAWLVIWIMYQWISNRLVDRRPNLQGSVAPLRRTWMREAFERELRMTDAALVGNLMQSATFFSSTTLLVVGGLFALLGTLEKSTEVLQSLPFASRASQQLLEIKALALTLVFVYAFFRFTWALRQFNLVNILVGAFPPGISKSDVSAGNMIATSTTQETEAVRAASERMRARSQHLLEKASRLNELAGINFSQGLRAYYFSVPLLLWLINPWLLLGGSVVIAVVTYHMEFLSPTARALDDIDDAP